MRTFIFGAGASVHAGYPLNRELLCRLIAWAEANPNPNHVYWIDGAELQRLFPGLDDLEAIISELESPTRPDIVALPSWKVGSIKEGLRNAIAAYFDSLRNADTEQYCKFAETVAKRGDTVITFNYDVLLERELRRAEKWHIGDGYGFEVSADLPTSSIRLLKLHGSTNWIDLLFNGIPGFVGGHFGRLA